jgi:hypothetical protein
MIQQGPIHTNIDKLTDAAWQIAYTSLWNTTIFSTQEVSHARSSIKQFILNAPNPYEGYLEFCQRALMARQVAINKGYFYMPAPTWWLSPENPKGFAGTRPWFQKLMDTRKSFPLYRHQWKVLPEAILDMYEDNSACTFHYWRTWFIVRHFQSTVNVFLATLSNMNYK